MDRIFSHCKCSLRVFQLSQLSYSVSAMLYIPAFVVDCTVQFKWLDHNSGHSTIVYYSTTVSIIVIQPF